MKKPQQNIFDPINSVADIVDVMVKALKDPKLEVKMETFGSSKPMFRIWGIELGPRICVGCAATNTLCELSGGVFSPNAIYSTSSRAKFLNFGLEPSVLGNFEGAIDCLRCGALWGFRTYLQRISHELGFSISHDVKNYEGVLPVLLNEDFKENLYHYEAYAKWLRKHNY